MMKNTLQRVGLILSVLSFLCSAVYWNSIIGQAKTHVQKLTLNDKVIVLLVTAGVLGMVMVFASEWLKLFSEQLKTRKKTWKDWLIIGLFLLPGFIALGLLQHQLEKYGYEQADL